MILYLDTETYCETPIADGTHRYAEGVEVMICTYAIDDGPVELIEFPARGDIEELIDSADEIVIHNSHFDRTVLRHALGIEVPTLRIFDTMACARSHSLPGALGKLCEIMGVAADEAKDKEGKALIQLFCKPRPKNQILRRATKATHPAEWAQFCEYARRDILSMRALYRKLPRWNYGSSNSPEHALWRLDQKMNDRGITVDMKLAHGAITAVKAAKAKLKTRVQDMTYGEVQAATQRDKMLAHLLSYYGVDLPDFTKATLERRVEDENLPEPVRELLRIRLAASTTSSSKYTRLVKGVSSDGRLRGTLEFCGAARTGRWAGRMFQPQNLSRPDTEDQDEIDIGTEALREGSAELIGDVIRLAQNSLRGALIASAGCKLVVADLANIEGRVLAWLAGEERKLDAFRAYDAGDGPDLYKVAAAGVYGKQHTDISKPERQIGKVAELACGFQGAVGAFSAMAALYGVDLPEADVLRIVKAWRKAWPNIVRFWYDSEGAAVSATNTPGRVFTAGLLQFKREGAWLRMRLPSGRFLCYPSPRVENGKLSYMGPNQYTRRWERLRTYGGKLVENGTQATARDIIAHGMEQADMAGYDLLLSVHDEIIAETDKPELQSAAKLEACLTRLPTWAQGLPLAAEGFVATRYRK